MNLLIDESVDFGLLESCRQAGFDVLCIAHIARGVEDVAIIKMSLQMNSPILTEDKDFGEMVFKNKLQPHSVIFVRYAKDELPDLQIELFAFLNKQDNETLANTFTVITPTKTRTSRL